MVISFSIFYNMKVCCVFSLESPHRGTIYLFQNVKENHLKLFQICRYGIFFQGTQNELETAIGNEPSVFEPLKVYCTCLSVVNIERTLRCRKIDGVYTNCSLETILKYDGRISRVSAEF